MIITTVLVTITPAAMLTKSSINVKPRWSLRDMSPPIRS